MLTDATFSTKNILILCSAQLQIMGLSSFLTMPTGLATVLSIVWPQILLSPFHKKLIDLWDVIGFFAKQIIHDLVLLCIVIEEVNLIIHVENLLDEIWKLVKLVSYWSQQRESTWLDAFEILSIVVY